MQRNTMIIAEAGVNHNGDIGIAKKMIEAAAEAKADYVKFQTFKADKLVNQTAPKAMYQISNTKDKEESQLDMLKKLELSELDHYELIEHCNKKGIRFLSTAFDLQSLEFLKTLGISLFKIPSGEITNLPYLLKIAELAGEIILSTGMSSMDEIVEAVAVIRANSNADITVLHCNTEYPTPFADVNLLAMNEIGKKLSVKIGYSDHTLGIEVPIAAVALGATIIEKHFTLNRNLQGPDHAASLEPAELKVMVQSIRNIELALGESKKLISASEVKNQSIARKSIHLFVDKKKGEVITYDDLQMLRPGDGISPMRLNEVIGKIVKQDFVAGHMLKHADLE